MIWLLYSIQVDLTNTSCGTTEPFENRFWNPYQRICRYNELFFCAPSHKLLCCKLTRYSGNWIEPYLFADSLVGYRAKKSDQQNQLSAVWCLKKKIIKNSMATKATQKLAYHCFYHSRRELNTGEKLGISRIITQWSELDTLFNQLKRGF